MIKKIIFRTDDVTPCLASVASVVSTKNSMPILATVVLYTQKEEKDDGRLFMTLLASDGDLWVRREVVIDAESDRGISLCLDAKAFLQSIQGLPNTVVNIEVDESKLIATCLYVNGNFSMPFYKSDVYPRPSSVQEGSFTATLKADTLYNAMEKVSFAIANDPIFLVLNGIHLEFGENKLIAVATDKRRFGKYENKVGEAEENLHYVNLPNKPCKILSAALQEGESEAVTVSFDDTTAIFSIGSFRLTTRLLEGNYLNYNAIIPKGYENTIILDKNSLTNAVRRVSLMANSSDLVSVILSDGICTVSSEDLDNSKSATEKINCEYQGEPFKIGLSSAYLLSVLKPICGESVKMVVKTPLTPAFFFEAEDAEDYDYMSMLMPMKIL